MLTRNALSHLWTRAFPLQSGMEGSKAARDLLKELGVTTRPRPPTMIAGPIENALPPAVPHIAAPARPIGTPRKHAQVASPPPLMSPAANSSAPMSPPVTRPPRPEHAPVRVPPVTESPSVLGPPAPAPNKPAPPATTPGPVIDELVTWRCDSCGAEARVPRADAHRLCPSCFPQIRLDT